MKYKMFGQLYLFLFIFGCNTSLQQSGYFQAYDEKWDDPAISPIFKTEKEALDYATRNNMGSGHGYKVRRVSYRYEVRHKNDAVDQSIFHTPSLRDARNYLNEYGVSHTDLFLYDLKTGNLIETSTP